MKPLILIAFILCSIQVLAQDELDLTESTFNIEGIRCFSYPDDSLIVINSQQELLALSQISKSDRSTCSEYELPQIDFTKHTLMLYHGSGGGCGDLKVAWKLFYNVPSRKAIFRLRVEEVGTCRAIQYYYIKILTPKVGVTNCELNFIPGKMGY